MSFEGAGGESPIKCERSVGAVSLLTGGGGAGAGGEAGTDPAVGMSAGVDVTAGWGTGGVSGIGLFVVP